MPVTPYQLDLYSSNMAHLYQSLEYELIKLIVKRLNNGADDILEWQRTKLQELNLFNRETAQYISKVTKVSEEQISKMFESTGEKIVKDIDSAVPYEPKPLPNNLDNIMRAYFDQAWSDIDNAVNQTLLSTNYGASTAITQMYNEIINKTAASFNTGIFTFEQALERTIQQWAQNGIKSTFVDKGGHTWSQERYVRTVLKSTLGNTYDTLRKDRMAEYDLHTVLVTSHIGARQECSLIQGNVVDLRRDVPPDSEYRSIYDPYWRAAYGTKGGHRGINCGHPHVVFIPGANTNNQPKFDQKENKKVAELTQKQRRYERAIVKFKKNKAVAEVMGNENSVKEINKNIRRTQKVIRDLVDSNENLSRNYARERVYTPLDTLLEDFKYDQ